MIRAILYIFRTAPLGPKDSVNVFTPFEQRLFGLVEIAQGIGMLIYGKRVPPWTLRLAFWGAARRHLDNSTKKG